MIPKILHYTWFSDEPFPEKIQVCMATWSRLMPEYKFVHWDMKRIEAIDSQFLREAISVKKWAFASDYVRLWALFYEGGIYLDTDVMCFKSFDDLLDNDCFIGKETSLHIHGRLTEQYLSSHCMGAIPQHPFIKDCLDYYEGRHFIQSAKESLPQVLKFDMTLLPYIQSEIAKQYGYNAFPSADKIQNLRHDVIVYPSTYFDCKKKTSYTYCKHLAVGSWRISKIIDEKITFVYKLKWRIRKIVESILNWFGYVMVKKL